MVPSLNRISQLKVKGDCYNLCNVDFTGPSEVRPSKPGFGYGKQQQLRNLGVMIWLHAGYGGSMTVPKAKVCFQI